MARIQITVTDEDGHPLKLARVAFTARVITPRFVYDEAEALHLSGVDARFVELAVRTDKNGFAEVSERPAPRVLGPLGPLYVLARAAKVQAPTPYVDWSLVGGGLFLRIEQTGFVSQNVLAKPGQRVPVRLRRLQDETVLGRVLDSAGRLTWGAFVEVLEEERGPVLATAHSDPRGRFEIAVPRPGSFTLSVFPTEDARKRGERPSTVRVVAGLDADVRTVAGPVSPTSSGVVAERTER